ncbi:proteasome activator complex subunit 2 [Pyxicephalus adspersus]|uniref:Proteasome activator complex subunit 2 n=1 Tax=Pyxicephalus adspersus TaxID=30357 RepID=A0AAV3A7M9_PYXAD|nr:TPA: hypothetical protein GDO54_013493 [Pyxicephalus adspersus]
MSKASSLRISPAVREKVDKYTAKLYSEVQEFLSECVPEKIQYLSLVLTCDYFVVQDPRTLHAELNIPIPDPPSESEESKMETDKEEKKAPKCGFLKENENIRKIINIVIPEIRALREGCALLITWIHHAIPKIEDGNDFGVSIQEKVLERITAIKTKVETTLTNINKYYQERGDAVAKASKETHVMDYRSLVHDKDENAFVELRLALTEVRNFYIELFDIICKNFEKLTNPKGEEKSPMY